MPAILGQSWPNSTRTSSGELYFILYPIFADSSMMIDISSRASPGAFTALRTRCTFLSVFEKVPSFSAKQAEGRTTSASRAVSVMKYVLYNQEFQVLQCLHGMIGIGVADYGVFSHDIERLKLSFM